MSTSGGGGAATSSPPTERAAAAAAVAAYALIEGGASADAPQHGTSLLELATTAVPPQLTLSPVCGCMGRSCRRLMQKRARL